MLRWVNLRWPQIWRGCLKPRVHPAPASISSHRVCKTSSDPLYHILQCYTVVARFLQKEIIFKIMLNTAYFFSLLLIFTFLSSVYILEEIFKLLGPILHQILWPLLNDGYVKTKNVYTKRHCSSLQCQLSYISMKNDAQNLF